MKRTGKKEQHGAALLTLAALVAVLGLAACGGDSEPQRATEEALAATEADEGPDTIRSAADTIDTAGTWVRADTATVDTAAADTAGRWVRVDSAAGASSDTTAGSAPAPAGAGDVTYETYQNEKLGFSVRYPAGVLHPAGEVGNGNGRTFEASDGSASMLVYGTEGSSPDKLRRRFDEQLNNPDLNVTYQTRGDGWYVLSGYRGDHIFYERVEARDNTFKVVRMFYDRSRKSAFDPIVREVSASLGG